MISLPSIKIHFTIKIKTVFSDGATFLLQGVEDELMLLIW